MLRNRAKIAAENALRHLLRKCGNLVEYTRGLATHATPIWLVLARDLHREDGVVLVGFSSYHGSVIAAKEWGAQMEKMEVPEESAGSCEDVHHPTGKDQLLIFDLERTSDEFQKVRGHRAIGVV